MSTLHRTYGQAPWAPAYMLHAFRPAPGWNSARGCPDLALAWRGYWVEPAALDDLKSASGLRDEALTDRLCLLYPQVTGFRLVMALLTHPTWPLPIWNALQVRNRVRLHAPLHAGDSFDLEVGASGWRVLAKGVEIDIHSRLLQGEACRWESVVTFYYRGSYGAEAAAGRALGAESASPVVRDGDFDAAGWNVGDDRRWRYGRLTGDYNGLHQWDWYARRMGFPAAFPHPQRVLGQCLAHLPDPGSAPLGLDLWIKGPVFFGRDVTMRHRSAATPAGRVFGLALDGESRPALVGILGPGPPATATRVAA